MTGGLAEGGWRVNGCGKSRQRGDKGASPGPGEDERKRNGRHVCRFCAFIIQYCHFRCNDSIIQSTKSLDAIINF